MHSPLDRRVACSYCKAPAGERCSDGQGFLVNWCHAVRMTAASGLDPKKLLERIERLESQVASLQMSAPRGIPAAEPHKRSGNEGE